ncbi:MAG: hypothetical protein VX278_18275, partial [Myxococcota bacterium]|nr:hypothetical protein [Myxococcota bacterium]
MKISFTLDEQRLSLDISPEESAFSVLRKTETGSKIRWRCSPGSCVGLCTILLNEQPVTACSVPATQLDNSVARTLSSIPLERLGHYIAALSASGSNTCGYCSPNL